MFCFGVDIDNVILVSLQEITKLKNEIERHKRNIRKLEEEKGISVSQLKKTKPLVAKN